MNKLKPNFTQIPNVFLDEMMQDLEKSELKVILYVMRRTYGFGKQKDRISFSQMRDGITDKNGKKLDKGTGLKDNSISNAITSLEQKGILKVNRENMTNSYSLNLNYSTTPTTGVLLPQELSTPTIGVKVLLPQEIQKKEKESIQKKDMHFDSFWEKYPNKTNKKTSRELWIKHNLDSKIGDILEFIQKAKKTERWEKGFIKAPDVFIRNETWTDDVKAYKFSTQRVAPSPLDY